MIEVETWQSQQRVSQTFALLIQPNNAQSPCNKCRVLTLTAEALNVSRALSSSSSLLLFSFLSYVSALPAKFAMASSTSSSSASVTSGSVGEMLCPKTATSSRSWPVEKSSLWKFHFGVASSPYLFRTNLYNLCTSRSPMTCS